MSVPEALLLIGAAFLAGTINTIVGSGSLITFPTLLAIGYSPGIANVSNTVGITGGVLLLTLPSSVFDAVVPVLILIAVVLVILQPRLSRFVAERRTRTVE